MLDIILIVISALCMIAGLASCILPFLPGPPIAYVGLVILHFTDKVQYSTTQLIVWLLIVAVLQVLDYFTPMLGSKYSGGFCIALIYSSEFLFITAILSCNSLFWISDNLICSVWIF